MSSGNLPPDGLHAFSQRIPAVESKQFELLVLDYEQARDDERQLVGAVTTAFSVAVALLGLLGAAIDQAANIPQLMLAAAPLLPLALIIYLMLMLAQATLRSYYTRGLETELRRSSSEPITALGEVPAVSFMGIACEVTSLRRGRLSYRVLTILVQLILVTVFGGLTFYIGAHLVLSYWLQMVMLAFYGPVAFLILWDAVTGTVGGRGLFVRTARSFLDQNYPLPQVTRSAATQGRHPVEKERSLRSYLFFPRPDDAVKWLYGPVAFACAAWSTGNWRRWDRFVLVWLVLEYLIYFARYQWNDIRGAGEDAVHAERKARGRLPVSESGSEVRKVVLASLGVGLLRLASALAVGVATGTAWPIALLIAAVFGTAIGYETLRGIARSHTHDDPLKLRPVIVAIWIIVSIGYAVRVSVGFSYGGLPVTSATGIVGMVCLAAFGAMVVLLTWVLEATSFCRHDAEEADDLSKRDVPWNELTWYRLKALNEKPHLGALLRFADIRPAPAANAKSLRVKVGNLDDRSYCGRHPVLEPRGHMYAPWNLALFISCALASVLGVRLADPQTSSEVFYLSVATLSILGAFGLIVSPSSWWRLALILPVAVGIAVTAFTQVARQPVIAAIPWLVIAFAYVSFRGSSYRDLKKLGSALKLIPQDVLYLIIGRATADALARGQANRTP